MYLNITCRTHWYVNAPQCYMTCKLPICYFSVQNPSLHKYLINRGNMILTTTLKSFTESHVVSNKHFKTININALKSFMGFQRKESAENANTLWTQSVTLAPLSKKCNNICCWVFKCSLVTNSNALSAPNTQVKTSQWCYAHGVICYVLQKVWQPLEGQWWSWPWSSHPLVPSLFFMWPWGKRNISLPWWFPCALVFRVSSWEVVMEARRWVRDTCYMDSYPATAYVYCQFTVCFNPVVRSLDWLTPPLPPRIG